MTFHCVLTLPCDVIFIKLQVGSCYYRFWAGTVTTHTDETAKALPILKHRCKVTLFGRIEWLFMKLFPVERLDAVKDTSFRELMPWKT